MSSLCVKHYAKTMLKFFFLYVLFFLDNSILVDQGHKYAGYRTHKNINSILLASANFFELGGELCSFVMRKSPQTSIEVTVALCVIFMILVSLENVKKCVLGCCTITSKTKINVV